MRGHQSISIIQCSSSFKCTSQNRGRACRRLAAPIAVFSALLLLVAVSLLGTVHSPHGLIKKLGDDRIDEQDRFHTHRRSTLSMGFGQIISAICKHTPYPETCETELSSYPTSSKPSKIVSYALQAASAKADEALSQASRCAGEYGLQHLESQCASDCMQLMEDTKDRLSAAIAKLSDIGAFDVASLRSSLQDVKVWLSASLSYQAACADGFSLAPGSMQQEIQSSQQYLTEVVGNGLSLVVSLSELGDNIGSWLGSGGKPPALIGPHLRRRLLSSSTPPSSSSSGPLSGDALVREYIPVNPRHGFPSWVSAGERRLFQAPASSVSADAVVAQDGSGDYLNITAALANVPAGYEGRYVIYIKEGVYEEVFNVSKDLDNLTFLGDGMGYTIITGDRNVASGEYNTYRTSTVGIFGSGFFARDITFRNTAGPSGYQAVALRAGADFTVFYRCGFEGYQDTLYALSSRQFYRECWIYGTIDYIFGNAIAVFQNCVLLARLPLPNQRNTYTAQGRKLAADVSGYSFQNCTFTADMSLVNASYNVSTYLGRPWKAYSRVVIMQSEIQGLVDPAGWLPWNESNPFTDTLYYGEYQNHGGGATTDRRVTWAGVHPNMSQTEATQFTVQNFIAGETWISSVQVAYQDSL